MSAEPDPGVLLDQEGWEAAYAELRHLLPLMPSAAREVFALALELGTVLVARIVTPEQRYYRFEDPGDEWAAFTYDHGTAWLIGNPCSQCGWEGWVQLREGWLV